MWHHSESINLGSAPTVLFLSCWWRCSIGHSCTGPTGARGSIAINACEEARTRRHIVFYTSSTLLPVGKLLFLLSSIKIVGGRWRRLPIFQYLWPLPLRPFRRRHWGEDDVVLVPSSYWPHPRTEEPSESSHPPYGVHVQDNGSSVVEEVHIR